ncbi:MAG: transcriptional repressor [Actinobacteria bacterium]|nr:transcriptional repressor [Actinomycetota bacterium]
MDLGTSIASPDSTGLATGLAFNGEGHRETRQRRVIREWLTGSESFVSAQQVHDALVANGQRVGLTTVYRTLQAMADVEEVDMIRTDSGEALYRKCGSSHHHHLTCRDCGLTVELEGPSVEKWSRNAAATHGFSDVTHVVELFGVCAACSDN